MMEIKSPIGYLLQFQADHTVFKIKFDLFLLYFLLTVKYITLFVK